MTRSVKQLPVLKKRTFSPKQLKQPKVRLGLDGENQAQGFLKSQGWSILKTNWQFQGKEIDIIAYDSQENEIVFVEVKTRSRSDFGDPEQAVNWKKIKNMSAVAVEFIRQLPTDSDLEKNWRFDIISVLPEGIEHFKNITWP